MDVTVVDDDDGVTLQLRIESARHPGTPVCVRHPQGAVDTATDYAGSATVSDISHGHVSILFTPRARAPVRTAWVVL